MITAIPTIKEADILILDLLSKYRLEYAVFMPWQTTPPGICETIRSIPTSVVYRHVHILTRAGLITKHRRRISRDTVPEAKKGCPTIIASYSITHRGRVLLRAYREVFIGEEPQRYETPRAEGVPS